jgi:hypothetical protein
MKIQAGVMFGYWKVVQDFDGLSGDKVRCLCTLCDTEYGIRRCALTTGKSEKCVTCSRKRVRFPAYSFPNPNMSPRYMFPEEYSTWAGMRNRCHGPNPEKNYGLRGISVCARWRDSFVDFLRDMGLRPTGQHTIDRIDVNGNYEPSNCRWATKTEQARNRRDSLFFDTDKGQIHIMDAVEASGLTYMQVWVTIHCQKTLAEGFKPNRGYTMETMQQKVTTLMELI